MPSITIHFAPHVPYDALNNMRKNIVHTLIQQQIPVIMSHTDREVDVSLFDTIPSQTEAPSSNLNQFDTISSLSEVPSAGA
jgi:uncharacterized protein with HEPN domain